MRWPFRRRPEDDPDPFADITWEPLPPLRPPPAVPDWLRRPLRSHTPDPAPRVFAGAPETRTDAPPPSADTSDVPDRGSDVWMPFADDVEHLASSGESWSYAEDVPVGTACLDCTRWHLWAMVMALRRGVTGDRHERRVRMAQAAGEYLVLRLFDWQPEKIAAAPPAHQAAIATAQNTLLYQVPWPPVPASLLTAWASVAEAERFARSPSMTDRDRAEIRVRLDVAEALLVEQERVTPPAAPTREVVLQHLRTARHRLDRGRWDDAATLHDTAEALWQAALAAMPDVPPDTLEACLQPIEAAHQAFRAAMLAALREAPR